MFKQFYSFNSLLQIFERLFIIYIYYLYNGINRKLIISLIFTFRKPREHNSYI